MLRSLLMLLRGQGDGVYWQVLYEQVNILKIYVHIMHTIHITWVSC